MVVAALAIYGTGAFFSDTETSTGNTFTAGAIDLKVDSECSYNGSSENCVGNWGHNQEGGDGINITNERFFDFGDIKPGDFGEDTISLHVENNDAWVCAEVSNLTNLENGQTEPEALVDTSTGTNQGELQNAMVWTIWKDDGDNIQQPGEIVLYSGHPVNAVLPVYDSQTAGGALLGGTTGYLGFSWSLPSSVGNEVQTDQLTGNIGFSVVQSRHNDNFVCGQDLGGGIVAEDFGVMNQSGVLGYTAGFHLTDETLAGVQSIVVKLYSGNDLLQTNTATAKIHTLSGSQFSSPFDVKGTFNYAADGYWVNVRESEYGLTKVPTKVVATAVLGNGKIVTAENSTLTGNTTIIVP